MRVTENMRFNATVSNLFRNQAIYNDLTEKIGTQKKINRASDDPLSATKIITIRQNKAAIEQYMKNIDSCKTWISATGSTLSGVSKLLSTAKEIAIGGLGGDADARAIAADNIQAIIDSMRNLANTKWGDNYLFSGSLEGVEPFSAVPSASTTIDPAQKAADNIFTGTVTSSGIYTGTVNKTYAVKITEAGVLGVAKYRISTDGGRTWGGETLSLGSGLVDLGDGVNLTFDDSGGTKPLGKNDIFYVNANASGYYKGNGEDLSMTIDRDTAFDYNISGAEAFTAAGGVDIFKTLNDLKDALINNDNDEIYAQRLNIESASGQILLCQSLCGMKANHIEVVKNNLVQFDETLNTLFSDAQVADTTELGVKLLLSETTLKASYAMATKISETTILNYLK